MSKQHQDPAPKILTPAEAVADIDRRLQACNSNLRAWAAGTSMAVDPVPTYLNIDTLLDERHAITHPAQEAYDDYGPGT